MVNETLRFDGIWIPVVTPFDQGRVDVPALTRLVKHLAAQGVAGFVAKSDARFFDPYSGKPMAFDAVSRQLSSTVSEAYVGTVSSTSGAAKDTRKRFNIEGGRVYIRL